MAYARHPPPQKKKKKKKKENKLPNGLWGEFFIGKIWGEGCRFCDFLLIDWL